MSSKLTSTSGPLAQAQFNRGFASFQSPLPTIPIFWPIFCRAHPHLTMPLRFIDLVSFSPTVFSSSTIYLPATRTHSLFQLAFIKLNPHFDVFALYAPRTQRGRSVSLYLFSIDTAIHFCDRLSHILAKPLRTAW